MRPGALAPLQTQFAALVVLVLVVHAAALVSPAYADGSSEATIEQRSLDTYGLMRRTP